MNTELNPLKCLRFADLVQLGIVRNRMTLRRWVLSGYFPKPLRLSSNTIAWREAEIKSWLEKRERVEYARSPQEAA